MLHAVRSGRPFAAVASAPPVCAGQNLLCCRGCAPRLPLPLPSCLPGQLGLHGGCGGPRGQAGEQPCSSAHGRDSTAEAPARACGEARRSWTGPALGRPLALLLRSRSRQHSKCVHAQHARGCRAFGAAPAADSVARSRAPEDACKPASPGRPPPLPSPLQPWPSQVQSQVQSIGEAYRGERAPLVQRRRVVQRAGQGRASREGRADRWTRVAQGGQTKGQVWVCCKREGGCWLRQSTVAYWFSSVR